jgi:hypothetical protein
MRSLRKDHGIPSVSTRVTSSKGREPVQDVYLMLKHSMFSWRNFAYLYTILASSFDIISFLVLALWLVNKMLLSICC